MIIMYTAILILSCIQAMWIMIGRSLLFLELVKIVYNYVSAVKRYIEYFNINFNTVLSFNVVITLIKGWDSCASPVPSHLMATVFVALPLSLFSVLPAATSEGFFFGHFPCLELSPGLVFFTVRSRGGGGHRGLLGAHL